MSAEERSSGTGRSLGARVAVLIMAIGALGAGVTLLAGGQGPEASGPTGLARSSEATSSVDVLEREASAECAAQLDAIFAAAERFDLAFGAVVEDAAGIELRTWREQAALAEQFVDALTPASDELARLPGPTSGAARAVVTEVRSGAYRAVRGFEGLQRAAADGDADRVETETSRTTAALDDFYAGLTTLFDLEATGFVDVCPGG